MSRPLGLILVLIVLLASSCTPQGVVMPAIATPAPAAGLANPASVFCQEQGFRLELRTDATGSQSGICHFPDGSQCDEWAYYRGECRPARQAAAAPTRAPSPTRVASPTAVPLPATAPATAAATGATTYTSAALGISFSYLPDQSGQTVKVLEQGDKIYVYPANMEPTAGQWVQVFRKPADESLLAAITRGIMPGYPAQDCQVVQAADPAGAGRHAPNYEYAGIVVRRAPGEDDAAVLPRWRTCPQPYTVVGGIGYFQSDALHPSKFLFLSIGQYTILAGDDQPWQETIRFE
jgi:putative hemolysin